MLKSKLVNCLKCRTGLRKMAEQITVPTIHFHVSKVTENKSGWCFIMIKWLESGGRFNKFIHYDERERDYEHQQMLLSSMMHI